MKKQKNAGKGYGMMFHGAFLKKSDAKRKEHKTKGAFIRKAEYPSGTRFVVMSERKNPPKRHKRNPATKRHKKFRGRQAAERAYKFADRMRAQYPGRKVDVLERVDGSWEVFVVNEPSSFRNPAELMVMGANPEQNRTFTVPAGSTITIRTEP